MQLDEAYTPQENVEAPNFDPIPAGWYMMEVRSVDKTMTKAANGNWYFAVNAQVVEGRYENRFVYTNYNVVNMNEQTQRIARDHFDQLCIALGQGGQPLTDTGILCDRKVQGHVVIQPGKNGYADKNVINAWKNVQEQVPAMRQQQQQQPAAQEQFNRPPQFMQQQQQQFVQPQPQAPTAQQGPVQPQQFAQPQPQPQPQQQQQQQQPQPQPQQPNTQTAWQGGQQPQQPAQAQDFDEDELPF